MTKSFDYPTIDSKFIIETIGAYTPRFNVIKQLLTILIINKIKYLFIDKLLQTKNLLVVNNEVLKG